MNIIPQAGYDIVMLTSAHGATDDRIFYREAKSLLEAGFSVSVVGRHPVSEMVEGIAIHAVPSTGSRMKRLFLGGTILKLALRLKGRLYIFHDPELFGIGLLLTFLGKPVVYDSHENLPKVLLQKEWLPWPIRILLFPLVSVAEFLGSRLLSGVIAAVPTIQKRFAGRHTVLVRNFPTRAALHVLGEGPEICSRANVAIYTGGLSRIRGIGELVQAFSGIQGAQLWLVGKFDDPKFEREILSSLPDNVTWFGWKSFPDVLKMYRSAKIGMVLLYPEPNHRNSLPVKLFEYLGAGLPVVASDFPEFAEYVDGCGLQVDPHNVEKIRIAVQTLLSDDDTLSRMSLRARERAVREFSWEPEAARLIEFCKNRVIPRKVAAPQLASRRSS